MRTDRDIQRLLDQWLADGPNRASDRVFDEVVDRVNRQRQRPAWRLTWSLPTMNAILRPASVVGAVVVLALGGLFVLRRRVRRRPQQHHRHQARALSFLSGRHPPWPPGPTPWSFHRAGSHSPSRAAGLFRKWDRIVPISGSTLMPALRTTS